MPPMFTEGAWPLLLTLYGIIIIFIPLKSLFNYKSIRMTYCMSITCNSMIYSYLAIMCLFCYCNNYVVATADVTCSCVVRTNNDFYNDFKIVPSFYILLNTTTFEDFVDAYYLDNIHPQNCKSCCFPFAHPQNYPVSGKFLILIIFYQTFSK